MHWARYDMPRLTPCPHGGPDPEELEALRLSPDDILDFSVNCNPFGPPPGIKAAAERASWERLPEARATRLRQALAAVLGVRPANIVVGNGSVELIRFLAVALFGPKDYVVIPSPTFGEYEASVLIAGAAPLIFKLRENEGFRPDVEALAPFQSGRAKALFLCNPNNPTGVYLSREDVLGIVEAAPERLVVLDEAYLPFVDGAWDSLELLGHGNVVLLRSMTKDFALGGLRLGYAVGPEPLMESLSCVLPPWNVNAIAQEAGLLALEDPSYPARCLPAILEARDYLIAELQKCGLPTLPSRTNFFLVKVGDAPTFRRALLRQGLLVRDCTSFGLPDYVRIAALTLPECRLLIEAVGRVLCGRHVQA